MGSGLHMLLCQRQWAVAVGTGQMQHTCAWHQVHLRIMRGHKPTPSGYRPSGSRQRTEARTVKSVGLSLPRWLASMSSQTFWPAEGSIQSRSP